MANLKEIKQRISSITSTQQITKAMKMVAAAKLRKAQDRMMSMRPYAASLNRILVNVSQKTERENNPFAVERGAKKVLLIPITSDRGLCGPFNSNIIKSSVQFIQELSDDIKIDDIKIDIMPLGTKGNDFFKKRDEKIIAKHVNIFQNLSFDESSKAMNWAMDAFKEGIYDKVVVVYNEFKNVAVQIVRQKTLLPIELSNQEDTSKLQEYLFEPSEEEVLDDLIPKALKIKLFSALLESNASEHSARMTAMSKATDNANDLLKELKLTYNRTRQAQITKEILEIVGGAEALAAQ